MYIRSSTFNTCVDLYVGARTCRPTARGATGCSCPCTRGGTCIVLDRPRTFNNLHHIRSRNTRGSSHSLVSMMRASTLR